MSKEICISSTPHETRLAILEDDQLAEIYYERENEYTLAGSIYKGRVTRVLPGMQSAFVEVGLERDAFLYVTDFLEEQGDSADFEKVPGGGGGQRREAAPPLAAPPAPDRLHNRNGESGSEEPRSDSRSESRPDARPDGDRNREPGTREPAQQRSRGRGRNRGRGGDRGQNARPDPAAHVAPEPIAVPFSAPFIEPFDSASFAPISHTSTSETAWDDGSPQVASEFPAPSNVDEESPEGTRRWRGRRGRRGGARIRDPREQEAASAPRPAQPARPAELPAAFSESEPIPYSAPSINAQRSAPPAPQSTTSTPIVLPGESLSKYGHAPSTASQSGARPGSSVVQKSPATFGIAPPSTLVEIPLSWDGSGALPGETINRYRKSENAPAPPVQPRAEEEQASPGAESMSAEHSATAERERSSDVTSEQSSASHQAEPETHAPEEPEQSVFETAYEAHQKTPAEETPEQQQASHEASHSSKEGTTHLVIEEEEGTEEETQVNEDVTEEEMTEEELTDEVTEYEPEEASASHRVDPSAPSEFRVATPFIEDEAEEELEAEEIEAPVAFHSVAPEEVTTHEEFQGHDANAAPSEQHTAEEHQAALEHYAAPDLSAATAPHTTPEQRATPERNPTHQPPAKPESFWKAVKELVTGHSSTRDESSKHETGTRHAETLPAMAAFAHDGPEQSLTAAYEDKEDEIARAHAAAEQNTREGKEPEPLSSQMEQANLHLGQQPTVDLQAQEDDSHEKGFAPGSGLLEEETIEDEEYDYEPMHGHSDEHDLEDLEEETLDHQGVMLGEVVREAHLEQRVKSNFNADNESEEGSYAEDASGGFTEEDFDGPGSQATDEEEGDEPLNVAAPTDSRRDSNRNGERSAGGGRAPSDRSRGRGRRPGQGGNGGSRRQNTQASDLPVISELLKQGQEILVQIAKEPIAKKGARITSHIALPGRFLVFMPTVNHVGVSRKISSDEERQRLKQILISEKGNALGGFIVRTAADGASEEDLRADIRFLLSLWSEIKQRSDEAKAPALIYHDLNLIERVLRDQVSDNFSAIWVDSETEYERIVRFLQRFQPSLVRRVKLYTKETPLFEHFGITEEISKALKSKVWLKSGGSIVINQTEALVAIDINTGKFVGKTTRLEDTILRTNLDSIPEIVRQIRLRDLGGIIVIDFIDMDERRNRNRVMQALEDELKHDRAPSKVLQFNDFGLVVITRKRVKQSLERTLSVQCEVCTGTGMVKSPVTVCNEIYTEMRKMYRTLERKDVMLRVHPEVVKALKAVNGRWLNELEEMTGKTIIVKSDPALHPEQFDIH
ncbi:MAG TPA: Rne/Rng family ribonuclease [Acidisarcina sp.]